MVVTKASATMLGGGRNWGGMTKRDSSSHAISTPTWGAARMRRAQHRLLVAVMRLCLLARAATTDVRAWWRTRGSRALRPPPAGAEDRPRPRLHSTLLLSPS